MITCPLSNCRDYEAKYVLVRKEKKTRYYQTACGMFHTPGCLEGDDLVQVQVCKTRAARSRGCAVNYLPVIAGGGGVCTITKVDTLMHPRMYIIVQCRGSYTTP